MKVGYTEFSYGYAFTENLIRSLAAAPTGAPVFPNLVQEAKIGYDVKIELPAVPLFFQFKLPERMKKGTAFEIASGLCSGLTIPFYRIALMRRDLSKQHSHLIDLEKRFPGCVWYAAPCIADIHAFNRCYGSGRVFEQTAFFSPTDIGPLPDNKQHTIAYRHDLSNAFFCSDPQEVASSKFDDVRAKIEGHFTEKRYGHAPASARSVREEVEDMASREWRSQSAGLADRTRARLRTTTPDLGSDTEREQTLTDLIVAREIARVDLGVELLLAQPA